MDLYTAAHLLNRAGFGGTPDEIEALQKAGLEAAVEGLLHPPNESESDKSQPWTEPENLRSRRQQFRQLKANPEARKEKVRALRIERRDELLDLRVWWLSRMQSTAAPLVEKMTLFWHGHFATSAQKVKNAYWMSRQNETFRRNALGNFKILLHEISRDPAMMIYLDLARSQEQHPNENWAREVLELFTLGIGHYSEEDIRESARAFTGYRINLTNQQFRFEPRQQDTGWKEFLGRRGHFPATTSSTLSCSSRPPRNGLAANSVASLWRTNLHFHWSLRGGLAPKESLRAATRVAGTLQVGRVLFRARHPHPDQGSGAIPRPELQAARDHAAAAPGYAKCVATNGTGPLCAAQRERLGGREVVDRANRNRGCRIRKAAWLTA